MSRLEIMCIEKKLICFTLSLGYVMGIAVFWNMMGHRLVQTDHLYCLNFRVLQEAGRGLGDFPDDNV